MQQSNLNLIPSGDMPVIYASQYDNNRVIRFNLFDGEDEYTLSGTETVKCNIRKNDEHIVVITPTIGANKYIDVYLTEQACACFGDNIGEITISSDEDIIGTINFILKVERNPIQGGVTSATDIDDLESQIEDIVHEVMSDDYYTRDEVDAKLDLKANASDVYTKSEVDTALASKANASDVYTKSQVDTALGLKADKSDTYTKAQVDTALATKADASSVYTKSEVDTALAAKANASDVYTKTEVDEMIDALYPVDTVTGSIANFTTSLAKPLTELTSTIVAQQSGTGTPSPSNPRSISGVSSVVFKQTGKNLFDPSISSNINTGITIWGLSDTNIVAFFNKLPVGNYRFSFKIRVDVINGSSAYKYGIILANSSSGNITMRNDETNVVVGSIFERSANVNVTASNKGLFTNFWFYCGRSNVEGTDKCTFYDFQLEVGNTQTAYEAYNSDTFTIQLGQTVYGGVIDAKSGKASKTFDIEDLGDLTWTYRAEEAVFYSNLIDDCALNPTVCKCSAYDFNASANNTSLASIAAALSDLQMAAFSNAGNKGRFVIKDSSYTDATTFVNSLSGQQILYPLATPVEITGLTPDNFTTINGEQNIFSDCGEVTVGFKQGIQAYIDSKIGG